MTTGSTEVDWTRFQVGQRVWCINSNPEPYRGWLFGEAPKEGEIYTIESFFLHESGTPCCTLIELNRAPRCIAAGKRGYGLFRFEPVREQNIELFRRMCLEVPVRATELQS